MIYLITGQPGTGKTTLADALEDAGLVQFVVDGDRLRNIDHPGYDRAGRLVNVDRAHAIALYLHGLGFSVAVSLIQPYADQRQRVSGRAPTCLIHMSRHYGVRKEYWTDDYEPPPAPDLVDATVADVEAWLKRPRATFIGRYQTLHDGHRWLFQQALDRGDPVTVMVRDTPEERSAREIRDEIRAEYVNADVRVIVIPNVKSIEYGRGVGYGIVEHQPPEAIRKISGTAIRAAREEET